MKVNCESCGKPITAQVNSSLNNSSRAALSVRIVIINKSGISAKPIC